MGRSSAHRPLRHDVGVWRLASLALLAACSHDWEAYLPPTGGATSSTAGAGAVGGEGGAPGVGGAGGAGGAGGTPVPVTCPVVAGTTALVPVASPSGSYCIDATEVSRALYLAWLDAGQFLPPLPQCTWNTERTPSAEWPPAKDTLDLPVTYVDWCDAYDYCAGVGKRMCGRIGGGPAPHGQFADPDAEWFHACSAGGTLSYPYGDRYQPDRCNGADSGNGAPALVGSGDCVGAVAGLYDMSGNVWEWEDACMVSANPVDDACHVRGGGFSNSEVNLQCDANGANPRGTKAVNVGFRCCADAD